MKPAPTWLIIFSLILGACIADARRDPEKYWKTIMNDEAMPKALSELLLQDPPSQATGGGLRGLNMGRFIRNFDAEPNVILYHSKEGDSKRTSEHAGVEN